MDQLIGIEDSTNVTGMTRLLNTENIDTFKASEAEKRILDPGNKKPKPHEYIFEEFKEEINTEFRQFDFDKNMDSRIGSKQNNLSSVSTETRDSFSEMLSSRPKSESNDVITNLLDSNEFNKSDNYTKEQHTQRIVDNVVSNEFEEDYITEYDEEDEKMKIIERIDLIRDILNHSRIPIDRIKTVDMHSNLRDIKFTLNLLERKNNSTRHAEFGEDCILAATYLLEDFFDGDKEYFGRHPDLTDFHKTVNSKLPRMRYDIIEVSETVIESIGLGPMGRLMCELVPSAFTYSRQRKTKHNKHVVNDADVDRATNEILRNN